MVCPLLLEHVAWQDRQIAELESDIDDHIDGHPELKRDAELIRSIPGIGEKTAARILAYLGDVRRLVHLIYGVVNSGQSFDAQIPLQGLAVQDGI